MFFCTDVCMAETAFVFMCNPSDPSSAESSLASCAGLKEGLPSNCCHVSTLSEPSGCETLPKKSRLTLAEQF
eukprot:s3790_g24.t1